MVFPRWSLRPSRSFTSNPSQLCLPKRQFWCSSITPWSPDFAWSVSGLNHQFLYIYTKWLKTNYRIDSFLLENILISNAAGRGYAPSAGLPDAKVQEDFKSRRNTCMPAALFNRVDMAHALDVQQVQIIVTKKRFVLKVGASRVLYHHSS